MKGRTRHTLLLIGAPKQALALGASARPVRPLHRSATKLRTSP
jgi:hypothetical protein